MTEDLRVLGTADGSEAGAVPDVSLLPEPVRAVVESAYGDATAELFVIATPLAALALVTVLFIKEKTLKTTSGSQRLVEERAAGPSHRGA